MKTRSKNTFILLLMSILLVFAANSMVFAGAGEPGEDQGDKKYSGPAAIVELNMQSCVDSNPNEVVVTGSIKCKGVTRPVMLPCQFIELCGECETFDEITQDDLVGFTLYNELKEGIRPVCDVDASPAAVRVVTKFENSGGVINVSGVCLFEKSQF